jgi:DNA polymerase-3 subunit alpha
MHHSDYVSLHLHSEYSLLDGAIRIDELVEAAVEYRMPAVAVTDHGNLFGAVEFYKRAVKAGVKPILGCEVYVAPKSRLDKEKTGENDAAFHLVLLARNNDGYRNLITLVSRAYTEGFYYKPRIDRELLEQYSGGLIGLTACLQGEVPYYLRRGEVQRARDAALAYKHILGPENFFLELQANGLPEQEEVNKKLVELGRELHIGLVATNDCHYMRKSDARAHEVLLCIQTGKTMGDPGRMRFEGDGFYFRSPDEMKAAFAELPEAVLNTREIAERCNVEFALGKTRLPRFAVPDGSRPREFLEKLARNGLKKRLGEDPPPGYPERFERELEIINKMGYPSYFLIVWDFINYAKERGIPVGPGRGSAAGSLIAYCLGITEIDPIKYGLLFERFLNPERVSMPDIDVDFCRDRRQEVIDYVSDKYGRDHVAQIITFGTMAARAAIRDVARAVEYPYADADRLAKLVPEGVRVTIKEALRLEPALKEMYEKDGPVRELLDIAMRLEGLNRHASTHAAGVVIAPEPLTDVTPIYKGPQDDALTTQFDMGSVESLGLIKFDFLGLKTLTIIDKTLQYLRAGGVALSLEDIPLDDGETYEFLSSGATTGVFQLESDGMKDILVKMRPSRFEDLIALVALYRPGPIKSGMIDDFIKRKKGRKAITYELPELKEILDETYGVILYQEQVMSIANRLAGFTMGQADVLRKAMGKKKAEVMEEQKDLFIRGAVENGIPEKKAGRLFDLMAFFAEYGFNKSHSAAYAYISCQTAYLKAHHPVEFMAATLSMDQDNSDKVVKSIKECRNMGIDILPPDVNLCGREFTVDGSGIRFGLGAVKGAGAAAVEAIVAAREPGPFASVEDYLRRTSGGKVNRKVTESLIKAGAFDSLGHKEGQAGGSPASLRKRRAEAMELASSNGGGKPTLNLFGGEEHGEREADGGWDETELLKHEKEALGFYITGNPLRKYSSVLSAMGIKGISALKEGENGREVETAGIITGIRKIRTRKGDMMAALSIEDEDAWAEAIVFPDLYKSSPALMEKDTPVLVRGSLEVSEKGIKIVAKELSGLDGLMGSSVNGKKAVISINGAAPDLRALKGLVEGASGSVPLYLSIRAGGAETLIQTSMGIAPDNSLIDGVEETFGKGALRMV